VAATGALTGADLRERKSNRGASQRRGLHELRQRRIVGHQGFAAFERHEGICELPAEQRRARGLRQSDGPATRRLDVETKWLTENGIRASKDFLTVEENNRLENYSEETVNNYWAKATKIAGEVLK
jgi:hypothetical protein